LVISIRRYPALRPELKFLTDKLLALLRTPVRWLRLSLGLCRTSTRKTARCAAGDFQEVSKRPLAAHLSSRIAELTENAGRLQALSREKAVITGTISELERERARVEGRRISDATRNELKTRRARLEEVRQKLSGLAHQTQQGLVLLNRAA
jgi:hypothetical protein